MNEINEPNDIDQQIVNEARLRFIPPFVEFSSNPRGFEFHWTKMQYAFGLPDPSTMPPFEGELTERDAASVNRFIETCIELSSYSLLNHDGGIQFSWTAEQGGSIEVDNPPKEALRGFSVLFRQVHDDTNASFRVVSQILERLTANIQDDDKERRQDFVRQWRSARRSLIQNTLHDITEAKLLRAQGAPPEFWDLKRKRSPLELLSLHNYGEYIHWGDKREQHAALLKDPVSAAFSEFEFHSAMIGLTHFYLGYAKVLKSAFPQAGP